MRGVCLNCERDWFVEKTGLCKPCYWKSRYKEHYHLYVAKVYKRRGLMQARMWPEDAENVKAIYRKARKAGLTVDHIVPLQGKNVSGLHVSWNMQLMPMTDNTSKGNRI